MTSLFTLHRQAEQRVPDHQAGVIIGGVGELQLSGRDVADRIDAPVGGLEPLVHHDAGAVVRDAGGVEIEPVGRRLAAGGDQQMACPRSSPRRRRLRTSPPRCRCACLTRTTLTPLRMTTPSRSSWSSTIAAHSGSSLASGAAASSTVTALPSRRNACAISRPIGPAPMTMRCVGPLGEIENRLVGEIRTLVEPRDRRQRRRRSGRDHEAARADFVIVADHDGPAVLECARAPLITRTPSPVKRSAESVGAIAAITRCT